MNENLLARLQNCALHVGTPEPIMAFLEPEDVAEILDDIAALTEERDGLKEALEAVEWCLSVHPQGPPFGPMTPDHYRACPTCGNRKVLGHEPDCIVGNARKDGA